MHNRQIGDLILEDLVNQGLIGEEQISAFSEQQAKVRPAVERLFDEASTIANSDKHGVDQTREIFGDVLVD